MRIAIITREYPPETPWGGIGSFYKELSVALAEYGHEVEVFAQGIYNEHSEEIDGVLVHRLLARSRIVGEPTGGDLCGNNDLGEFAYALAQRFLEGFLERHHEEPFDVVEGHEHLGVNALINLYAPDDTITVTRYHTSYHSLVSRKLVDWPVSNRISRLESASVRQADYRIATSAFIDEVVRDDFGFAARSPVLANFMAPPPAPEEPVPERENLMIFAGRLVMEHKRPDLAARAFFDLSTVFPDWRIEFAGPDMSRPDGGTTWEECRAIFGALDSSRYHYHGVLDGHAMDRLYRRARLLIVPSRFESFGMVAIEAMHRGCVPVVADHTALTDATGDADLIFANGEVDSLKHQLHRLMADPVVWETKSRQCLERAVKAFDHTVLVRQNLEYFESLQQVERSRLVSLAEPSPRPKISIVTPSFNQGAYIEETIVSILQQDYTDFEHVVMDGGSTDETCEILSRYPHLRWRSEKDRGQTHAINKGLLESTGAIVAYLNSDDIYRPGTFKAVADCFQQYPDVDVLVGNCDIIDGASNTTGMYRARAGGLPDLVRYWEWDKKHCIPQQSVFFRRTLLTDLGLFDERYNMVMDLEFWLRIVASGRKFHVLDRTLAAFRIIPSTKTGGRTDEMYIEEYKASSVYHVRLPWRQRWSAFFGARRQVGRKLTDFAEHLVLSTTEGKRPLRMLGLAFRFNPLLVFEPRFTYSLVGAVAKGPNRWSGFIQKIHRNHLNRIWLRSQAEETN